MKEQDFSQITIDIPKLREEGIYIMVPAYAGQCFAAFTKSMMQLVSICAQHLIPIDTFFIYNESLITRARNYCADEFLRRTFKIQREDGTIEEKHFQHAMFIDTDIEFNPIDVLVMAHLQTDDEYDILCGPYTKKQINWDKIVQAVNKGLADEDPNQLERYIGNFVFNTVDNNPMSLNKPSKIYEGGTGFMMIRRDVFVKIAEDNPDISYLPDHIGTDNFGGQREISAFFDTSINEKRRYLSEDYHFCKLAYKSGFNVWLIPWFELKHHGYYAFGGTLSDLARAGLTSSQAVNKIKKK